MIDLWGLFHNALWIAGLALVLAVLSLARYHARSREVGLGQVLARVPYRLSLVAGLLLFCLGLALASRTWWEWIGWGLLVLLLAAQWVQEARLWLIRRAPRLARPVARRRLLGWGLVAAGLLLLVGWGAVTAVRTVHHARSLQEHLLALEELVGPELDVAGLEAAGLHLAAMHRDLDALDAQWAPLLPAARWLAWLPAVGDDLAAADDLLVVARGVVSAGDGTFRALSPALDLLGRDESGALPAGSAGEAILPVLLDARPALQAAQRDLALSRAALLRLEGRDLSPRLEGWLQRLDRYLPWLETAVDWSAGASSPLASVTVMPWTISTCPIPWPPWTCSAPSMAI
jgi:hypothetical protein